MSAVGTITVTSVNPFSKLNPSIHCEFCGSNKWLQRTPRSNTARIPVMTPCKWTVNGKEFYGHTGWILLAVVFENTINGQKISQDFCKIPNSEGERIRFVKKVIINLCAGSLGQHLQISTKLHNLKNGLPRIPSPVTTQYGALERFKGQDVYQAFFWISPPPSSNENLASSDGDDSSHASDVDSDDDNSWPSSGSNDDALFRPNDVDSDDDNSSYISDVDSGVDDSSHASDVDSDGDDSSYISDVDSGVDDSSHASDVDSDDGKPSLPNAVGDDSWASSGSDDDANIDEGPVDPFNMFT